MSGEFLRNCFRGRVEYIKRRLDQSAFQEALRTKNFSLVPAKIARDKTFLLDRFDQKRADATYSLLAKNGTFLQKLLEEVPRARTLGVRILAGTDITIPFTYPGFSLHDELGLLVGAGLTPMQALETATTNPALILNLSKQWGRVDAGFTANFVVLSADPLADIANASKIESVVVNGTWLDRSQLDQMLRDAKQPVAAVKAPRH